MVFNKITVILFLCISCFIVGFSIGRKNNQPKKQIETQIVKSQSSSHEVKSIDTISNTQKTITKTVYRTVYRKDGKIQSTTKEVENIGSIINLNKKLDDRLYHKEQREEEKKNEIIQGNDFMIGLLIDPSQRKFESFSTPLSYKLTDYIMISSEFDWNINKKDSVIPFFNGMKIGLQCLCF